MARNIRCANNCGNSIKAELAEESDNWGQDEDGMWYCPSCNEDSDVSWE